ncbi:MAG: hypothetical protein ABR908_11830 [Terriglobales bacterium]|jgi:hypothetical protein
MKAGFHQRRRYRVSVALGVAILLVLPMFFSSGAALFAPLWAQERRHDPLNPLEIDQLRDAMMEPEARLKLYVQFSRDRMTKLEQMRSDPKTKERARQTHDMLEDFLAVYDELNDNVDMYVGRKDDIRKPLKAVIEADTEFQAKLRALKNSANTNAAELSQYEFLLTDALDTVDSSADDHRKTAVEVEEYMKKKKKQQK